MKESPAAPASLRGTGEVLDMFDKTECELEQDHAQMLVQDHASALQAAPACELPRDDTPKGMLLVGASALCFSVMTLLVSSIARAGIPSFQIVFINAAYRCILCVPQLWLCRLKRWPIITSYPTGVLVFLRALGGFGGITCAFYAFSVLPLGDATVILFTAPVWTSLLAALVLHESLHSTDCLSIVFSLAGVAMVARPGATEAGSPEATHRLLGSCLALAGAMFSAVAYCCVRKLSGSVAPIFLVAFFSLLSLVLSPGCLWIFGQQWAEIPDWKTWGYIAGMGPIGYVGQLLLNSGLQLGVASRTTLAGNLEIVFAFILQNLFLHDAAKRLSVAGACLIAFCSFLTFWESYRDGKADRIQATKQQPVLVIGEAEAGFRERLLPG